MNVLLMSPDPRSREAMRLVVASIERRSAGRPIRFAEAADGREALGAARREGPDVIVADEIASGMGAFALAKELRGAAEPYLGAIVILLEREQDVWLAEWSGADAWFVKPVDPFQLADRLLELVRMKELA